MKVQEFERRVKRTAWIQINRSGIAEVAKCLDDAASHIERVGWIQNMNFADPDNPDVSRCCAIGALHVVCTKPPRPSGLRIWTSDVGTMFAALHGMDLVTLNDFHATRASDVTTAMRKVAQDIRTYLEETSD